MATVIQNTIGTGGDYSLPQTWEDAAPADLVAADQIWEGLCLNETFASTSAVTIAGSTTNASCYKHLTAQVGESFADQVGQPLRIIPGNGALIQKTSPYSSALGVSEQYARVSRLQVWSSSSGEGIQALTSNVSIFDCIVQALAREAIKLNGGGTSGNNLLLIKTNASGEAVFCGQNATLQDSTIVCANAAAGGNALSGAYGAATFRNLAIFNFATLASGSTVRTYVNCFTDLAGAPAGMTTVPYDTTTGSGFVNISAGTQDFKLNPTSAMVDAGVVFAPYTDFDIYGTSRGATPDVGAYEIGGPPVGVDHATNGNIIGSGADTTGSADHRPTSVIHGSGGGIVGKDSVVVGSAKSIRHMATVGSIVGEFSNITGTAKRYRWHTVVPSNIVAGYGSITGEADNFTPAGIHDTYGDVDAGYGTVTGDSHSVGYRPTSGAVVGNPANVVGTAHHARKHTTTGNPIGNGTTITGTAARKDPVLDHGTFGTVTGYTSNVNGVAVAGVSTLTPIDIENIVNAVWSDPRALTVSKFLALQNP